MKKLQNKWIISLSIVMLMGIANTAVLYGMEPEQPFYKTLPKELKQEIINKALATSTNLTQAINAIKNASILHRVQFDTLFDNLEDFTKLAHILADKFNQNPLQIAEQFKKPTAKRYILLTEKLEANVYRRHDLQEAEELIQEGADVNGLPMLDLAVTRPGVTTAMIKLLLDHGADPDVKNENGYTPFKVYGALTFFNSPQIYRTPESEQIKVLLKNAMEKNQIK